MKSLVISLLTLATFAAALAQSPPPATLPSPEDTLAHLLGGGADTQSLPPDARQSLDYMNATYARAKQAKATITSFKSAPHKSGSQITIELQGTTTALNVFIFNTESSAGTAKITALDLRSRKDGIDDLNAEIVVALPNAPPASQPASNDHPFTQFLRDFSVQFPLKSDTIWINTLSKTTTTPWQVGGTSSSEKEIKDLVQRLTANKSFQNIKLQGITAQPENGKFSFKLQFDYEPEATTQP